MKIVNSKILPIIAFIVCFVGVKYLVSEVFFPERPSAVTSLQLEEAIKKNDQFGVFAEVKKSFPIEYDQFIQEMIDTVNSRTVSERDFEEVAFKMGQDFTTGLRRSNAEYIVLAPLENLRGMQSDALELLKAVQNNNELCRRIAAHGPAALTRNEVTPKLLEIVGKSSLSVFRAIAIGKEKPAQKKHASDEDFADVLAEWSSSQGVTDEMVNSLLETSVDKPIFCEANISFQEHIVTTQTDSTDRVIVTLTEMVVAN